MMKKRFLVVTAFFFLVVTGKSYAEKSVLKVDLIRKQVGQTINAIFAKQHPAVNVGLIVQSMANDRVLYRKNAERAFVPASTLKLFTATAALIQLGPQFHFTTEFRSSVQPSGREILPGDVQLVFDADPTLEQEDIENLLSSLKDYSVQEIKGNFYVENRLFDRDVYGPGWMWDELDLCYAAPLSSIIIDKNCFEFELVPAEKNGRFALLNSSPENRFTSVVSSVITRAQSTHCSLHVRASMLNNYYLSGCITADKPSKKLTLAIKNTALYAKHLIHFLLKKHHIKLKGKIIFGPPRKPLNTILAAHQSAPLHQLVKTMLKESDNLIADAVYKKLGAEYFERQDASWEDGAKAIEGILADKTGIDFTELHIVDGSGLSRYNLIRPEQTAKLLQFIYHTPMLNKAILAALPIGGVDGTLEKRMTDEVIAQRIYAKTGTMTGISALAGYIKTAIGPLSFVINMSGFVGDDKDYKALEDEICSSLATVNFQQRSNSYPL